jgi:hypothetical protein
MGDTPFETIENAHDYVRLLREQVLSLETEIVEGIGVAVEESATRRVDTIRLVVDYKLKQLDHHLGASSRILNDIRALVRLLTGGSRERAASGPLRSSRAEPVDSCVDG